eukprot:m.185588 g.185588  ORF g.185588 m.185588 type:complete len:81 (-) comp14733_c0_seq4:1654-1896(-)
MFPLVINCEMAEEALEQYSKTRSADVQAIADLALYNYVEVCCIGLLCHVQPHSVVFSLSKEFYHYYDYHDYLLPHPHPVD